MEVFLKEFSGPFHTAFKVLWSLIHQALLELTQDLSLTGREGWREGGREEREGGRRGREGGEGGREEREGGMKRWRGEGMEGCSGGVVNRKKRGKGDMKPLTGCMPCCFMVRWMNLESLKRKKSWYYSMPVL